MQTPLKRIALPSEGNPNYPLPPDWGTLTTRDAMRQARVNACRQWLIPHPTRELRGIALAACVNFFDIQYLHPDPDDEFDPLFYDDLPRKTPAFHFDMLRQWGMFARSVCRAPRGGAKTSLNRKTCPLQMLTRPAFSFIYCTSTGANSQRTSNAIKQQFVGNRRINDDFAPEMPNGHILPKRGHATFGTDLFYLDNGSFFVATSAGAAQRGIRPRVYVLDDPEYDEDASTSMEVLRADMKQLLQRVILPAMTRPNVSVRWPGTFITKQHYLWHAMETITLPDGRVKAADPMFEMWSRLHINAEYTDAQGVRRSAWPDMWPLTIAERDADPRLAGCVSLEEQIQILTPAVYRAEMMGEPGTGDESFFGEPNQNDHGWWIEEMDTAAMEDPLQSKSFVCWVKPDGTDTERLSFPDFLKRVHVFVILDTSYTHGTDSDRKVAHCFGYDPIDAILFSLDLWSDQCLEEKLIQTAFDMARRWHSPSIRPEVVKQSHALYVALQSLVAQRIDIVGPNPPRIIAIKPPPTLKKEDRTSTIRWRFAHNRIKLPFFRRHEPAYARLWDQTVNFTPYARNGGLAKDDEIDTVGMTTHIVRGRLDRPILDEEEPISPLEEILKGNLHSESGVPFGTLIDFSTAPLDKLVEAIHRYMNAQPSTTGTKA